LGVSEKGDVGHLFWACRGIEASGNRIPQAISFRGTGGHILRGKWAFKRGHMEYFEVLREESFFMVVVANVL